MTLGYLFPAKSARGQAHPDAKVVHWPQPMLFDEAFTHVQKRTTGVAIGDLDFVVEKEFFSIMPLGSTRRCPRLPTTRCISWCQGPPRGP